MHTSNGWHLDVQPAATSSRLVLFVAKNMFLLSVLCVLKTFTTEDRLKPNSLFFFSIVLP